MTIDELRARGFKVRVQHFRVYDLTPSRILASFGTLRRAAQVATLEVRPNSDALLVSVIPDARLNPRGGATEVQIQKDGVRIGGGSARCNPIDNYVKRTGRELALERALASVDGGLF